MRTTITIATLALASAQSVLAQAPRKATVIPGPEYKTGEVGDFFLGSNWRNLWTMPLRATVLDLSTFAGGIKPFRAGGNQSKTLRFLGQDGRVYIFRSMNKFVHRILPDDVRNTAVGGLIEDQTSAMYPSSAVVVARLQAAAGLLQVIPQIVVMPDDPRLGEFRKEYAGLVGFIEERPDEAGEDGVEVTTFGAEKIKGADNLLEDLETSFEDRLNAREYLTARLLDFIIGDTDRGADQWRWARFDAGNYDVYRPIPRDRDYAFIRSDGLLGMGVRMVFPKLGKFGPDYTNLRGLTFMTQEFDRSALVELSRQEWDSVTTALQSKLTDAVIADAVRALPSEHHRETHQFLEQSLRSRRDKLVAISRAYYAMVAHEADVFATDSDDVAEIERRADGSVEVRLYSAEEKLMADGGAVPAFRRLFVPSETKEIRIYLLGGDDRATVRGAAKQSIKVRVAGGAGDDVLIDSSRVEQGGDPRTVFYDAYGSNLVVRGYRTRIDTKPFYAPQPGLADQDEERAKPGADTAYAEPSDSIAEERRGRFQDQINQYGRDFLGGKTVAQPFRSWGSQTSWRPAFDYREGAGVIVGAGYQHRRFSFRHKPFYWDLNAAGLYSFEAGRPGVQATLKYNPENSKHEYSLFLRATGFEANRFYGFGNDTEEIDSDLSLVMRNEIRFQPALTVHFAPDRKISFGPVVKYVNARPEEGSPAAVQQPLGFDEFGQVGVVGRGDIDRVTADGAIPRSGWRGHLVTDAYPAVWDGEGAFGSTIAEVATYVPIGPPVLAFRLGGKYVWGDFPLHEAAFLGGRGSLRGYRWNRFAGDAMVYGGAEVRAPLTRVDLLVRGTLGVIGLADAGRVWFDGESNGGWHTGVGGGLWFTTLNRAVSVTYAKGETGRFYFTLGMPY